MRQDALRDSGGHGLFADDPGNARRSSVVSVFNDDAAKYTQERQSDYNGFGEFGTTVFNGSTFSPDVARTTRRFYPNRGTYPTMRVPSLQRPWTLNLLTAQEVEEDGQYRRVEYQFDDCSIPGDDPLDPCSKGFLARERRLRNLDRTISASDVIVERIPDGYTGNLAFENTYGGDHGSVPTSTTWRGDALTGPTTRLRYQVNTVVDGNITTRVDYLSPAGTEMGFFKLDITHDTYSGLVMASRDVSDVVTTYAYDLMGRPTEERPTDRAWTIYSYEAAAGTAPAKAISQAYQYEGGGTPLTTTTYEFDDVGRLVRTVRDMPGSTADSEQRIGYDGLNRKIFVTELGAPGSTARTSFAYDAFGRVLTETFADNSVQTHVYQGRRYHERRRSVATTVASQQEVAVSEEYDALGRLVAVTERSGDTSYGTPLGTSVTTRYAYNGADLLAGVFMTGSTALQERLFDYDGRGFLRWESHPEAGLTTYTYDARGKVRSKTVGATNSPFDLQFEYDAAERIEIVSGRNPHAAVAGQFPFREIKSYMYGSANVPGSRVKGKLQTATRYNYGRALSDGLIRVSDTFRYFDEAGALTDRVTDIAYMDAPDGSGTILIKDNILTYRDFTDLGTVENFAYPMCPDCGGPPVNPRRDLRPAYDKGLLVSLEPFISSVSYWPNQMRNVLTHKNGMVETQTVGTMRRPTQLKFAAYDRCVQPTFAAQPTNATTSGATALVTANMSGTAPFTYQWWSLSGAVVGTTASVSLAPGKYYVSVGNACGFVESDVIEITTGGCTTPTTGQLEALVQPDGTWTLRANPTARAGATFRWKRMSDGALFSGHTVSVGRVSQTTTFEFTVADVTCGSVTGQLTIQARLPAPASLTATMVTTSSIRVDWSPVPGATSYKLERRSGSSWLSATVTGTTYLDTGVGPGATYAYRVSAGDSLPGVADVATTGTFTAPVSNTDITAAPFNEMLRAVNSVRRAAGLLDVSWSNILGPSDPLPQPGQLILARHVTACRARMNEALTLLGSTVLPYSVTDLALSEISAALIREVQERAQ